MEILNPYAAGFLLGIPILVLLYLLASRTRVVTVSSLQFWTVRRDRGDRMPRWRRFYDNPRFYLQLLVLLLLTGALLNPIWKAPVDSSHRRVLVIDTSAGMKTMEGEESRMELAKREALRIINGWKDGSATLMTTGAHPRTVDYVGVGVRERAAEAIRNVRANDGPAHLLSAVQAASRMAEGNDSIALVTDGAASETLRIRDRFPNVQIVTVGKTGDNVAVTGADFSEDQSGVVVTLKNEGDRVHPGRLELLLDGRRVSSQGLTLSPHEEVPLYFPMPSTMGRVIEARLQVSDALAADNRAWAVRSGTKRTEILLVSAAPRLLERTLRANDRWDVTVMGPSAYESSAETLSRFDVILFDHYRPVPAYRPRSGRQGRFFIALPGSSLSPVSDKGETQVVDWDSSHPVMRFVEPLGSLYLRRTTILSPPPWAEVLADDGDHPLIYSETGIYGRSLILAFDPWDSNFPESPSFPVFLLNAVQWLQEGDRGGTIHAGEVYTLRVPSFLDGTGLWIRGPEGGLEKAIVEDGLLRYGHTDTAGIYRIRGENGFEAAFAVNVDPEESSTGPRPLPLTPGGVHTGQDRTNDTVRIPLWKFLALLSMAAMILEWTIRKRRSLPQPGDPFTKRHSGEVCHDGFVRRSGT
jgi:hypothetical protein